MLTPEQLNNQFVEEINNEETTRKQGLFLGILLSTLSLGEITGFLFKYPAGEIVVLLLLCSFFSYGIWSVLEYIKR